MAKKNKEKEYKYEKNLVNLVSFWRKGFATVA